MAQCRSNTKVKESLRVKNSTCTNKDDSGCDTCAEESLIINTLTETETDSQETDTSIQNKPRPPSSITLRSSGKSKAEPNCLPDVDKTGISPTSHSNMKTKQAKEESDKSIDEESIVEPKTRARKKASDITEDDKSKPLQDEAKPSKEIKKTVTKPKAIVKKRPLGIRKTLRSKKAALSKDKIKAAIKQTVTRTRKTAVRNEPGNSQDKDTVPLIPASEIKKEPVEEPTFNSRSSSPKTAGRRQRLTSDMMMMKTALADSSSSLLGPRTSPYSMRSERSNSPLLSDGKNLRSGKPRKVKSNLLNEVVMKEQKKRRRLLSDSKTTEATDANEDCKKLKRGRSCSRDGSEISKCSDITESDLSVSEAINDTENKELNKKLEKSKTDLDIDIENNVQISTTEKVPSLNVDSNVTDIKITTPPTCITNERNKRKLSLQRSTSLDSDNNNSNRLKLEGLNSSDIELLKTENHTLFEARSSILTSMSKTFNSKEMSKNIRKARRGRKAAAAARPNPSAPTKAISSTITNDTSDEKHETLETLSKEIDDLINDLDQNIDRDHELATSNNSSILSNDEPQTKSVTKFYGLSKPLGDNNSIITPETPVKDKEAISSITNENTPSKNDDSENIRLHYDEDSVEKSTDNSKHSEITYKCNPVASIDKLMDRLKEFEEFDKRRQRQESESKSTDSKSVMVTNDVVLINKSGADIKPLKDIQSVRSPEKPIEKENVLSCFENNSAISIVKRDQVRKSVDIDLPNSVTLIKRNSVSARKESTSSNHSKEKEADAISIFEKSLGKDVTLTEIRKSVDKSAPTSQIDLHQFATLHPNTPSQNIVGVVLDTNQISITPRVMPESKINSSDVHIITKRKSRESLSRKSSESTNDPDEKMATLEKIKSPSHQLKSAAPSIKPLAAKSEAKQPVNTEALPPPIDNIKPVSEDISVATEVSKIDSISNKISDLKSPETSNSTKIKESLPKTEEKPETVSAIEEPIPDKIKVVSEEMEVDQKLTPENNVSGESETSKEPTKAPVVSKNESVVDVKVSEPVESLTPAKNVAKGSKSARNSTECQAGPSNILLETPESQKRKENILRTLGLLTHKAAKEAKIEKLKEKERLNKSKVKSGGASVVHTGSLKAVIKLNRGSGDKKKYRSSLKMTFQKSKNRSGKPAPEGEAAEDDAYYTIERREGGAGATTDGGHRKSHYSNRLNNHDPETAPEPTEPKETLNLVIPEKASSFSIHPGRLCMDQCFYCGGTFGLFDTPCHIAQMKSAERQKKVLDNEEKLTIDSCLCDACYRHVDRRANCPSYRKRPLVKSTDASALPSPTVNVNQPDKTRSPSLEEDSEEEQGVATGRVAVCHTEGCTAPGDHSIRRKWLIKMRSSVNKVLQLKCDYPGLHTIPLCGEHHRRLAPLTACALCRRRITKHHNVHSIHGYSDINPHLTEAGIPVQFTERPLLCKVCRVYCTMLQRSGHEDPKAKGYRRKLLQMYNIEVPPENENEPEESIMHDDSLNIISKQKKKQRTNSKQRKSTDPERTDASESSERTTPHEESSPEKSKDDSDTQKSNPPIEEDIESLISSNKIPVPGAMKATSEQNPHSDGSESEIFDMDAPLLPIDKQTELQYLLQKQNNPAQFLHKPTNLTQKHSLMKLHAMSGVHKPGHHHRINEKNAKRIHKIGQIFTQKERSGRKDNDAEMFDPEKMREGAVIKNMSLNDECTIETIPNKRPADIATLKNKWQLSESFTQVKKNLSELSKKLSGEKEPKKGPEVKYSNPVRRLETNPSISVRELFPGEEEMNLQCNVEFNNVKGVTPEGWEKCNTMIQYDAETKKLWNELQRPYGNQSSFLRHLVLLEKYFRNGDLILSHNASPNAVNYSDSVQNRLRAYDNVASEPPKRTEQPVSLMEFRKKPSMNGKSLLKSNQNAEQDKDPKKFMPPPPGILPKPKPKSDKAKAKPLPPELIAINTPNAQGRKAIQNVLHNIQQLVKGVSASDPTEVAAAPVPKFDSLKAPSDPPVKEKKDTPKSDTPKKQKTTSKPWRPTLMPITQENLAKIAREPTQVAVDGRTLPSLVQVMSSGKRYHITLQDYNKMCIMRREKLQQLQDGEPRVKETLVTEIQPSAMLGNGGTVVQNISSEEKIKEMPELTQMSSNAATILKNVGLKNITIAPIPPKTATVTSGTVSSPVITSPAILVASAPVKIPQLGPAISITSETVLNPPMVMPKIPKSLTVIPQTVVANVPQSMVVSAAPIPSQAVVQTDGQRP